MMYVYFLDTAGIPWIGWFESIPIHNPALDLLHPLWVEIPSVP